MNYQTEQEKFWATEFGNDYVERNKSGELLGAKINFLSRILEKTRGVNSVIEFGANIGLNLVAIHALRPHIRCVGVEINEQAATEMRQHSFIEVNHQSILDFKPQEKFDLVLFQGVLIHLNPQILPAVYEVAAKSSQKYVCFGEYYNPSPVEINYRGHTGKLFKRDFAGEFMDKNNEFKLADYGFSYHRDPVFPQDDITWFLMERRGDS